MPKGFLTTPPPAGTSIPEPSGASNWPSCTRLWPASPQLPRRLMAGSGLRSPVPGSAISPSPCTSRTGPELAGRRAQSARVFLYRNQRGAACHADDPPRSRARSPPSRPNRIALRTGEGQCLHGREARAGCPTATRLIVGRRPLALRAGDIRSCPVIVRRLSFHWGTSTFPGRLWWLPTEGGGRDAP
jgi:hypothetical protein